jgi:sugar/nucleoside kinase (ribokinase family)
MQDVEVRLEFIINEVFSDMEDKTVQVIGVGSPVVDFVIETDDEFLATLPGRKGGMELVDSPTLRALLKSIKDAPVKAPGGSAGNTTFALARMGMPCGFMGKVGRDDNGDYYKTLFKEVGGDVSRFKTDGADPTACCVSLVTPDSERTMRTDLGAAMGFSPADIGADDFKGCRHVHVEGYLLFNRELLFAVLEAARASDCTVSLDLGSFEVVDAAKDILPGILKEYVDIVFANEEEAAAFSGSRDPETGLAALGHLCRVAAVKVGKDGAYLKDESGTTHVPAMVVDKVIDTTGAGDYWAAGFLFAHLNGYSLTKSGCVGALFGKHVIGCMGADLPADVWGDIIAETTLLLSKKEENLC